MAERLLTEKHLQAEKAKPDRDVYLSDGGGLYARVLKGGADRDKKIIFQYRYKLNGHTGIFHCGTYPKQTLAQARKQRDSARQLRDKGIDPTQNDKRERADNAAKEQAQALEKTLRGLFEDWERVYLKKHHKDGGALVRDFIDSDVLGYLGKVRARDVTRQQLVQVIDRIADRGANRKANAVLSLAKQMFKHGLARGIVDADPTYGLTKGHAGGKETPRDRNLSPEEITDLAKRLPSAALPLRIQVALWLVLATGARAGELIRAGWSEFDLEARIWTIPAERSKNGKPHLVHLSDFAMHWIKQLQGKGVTALLFEGRTEGEPLSEKWISKCLRDRQRTVALKNRTKKTGVLMLSGGEWRTHDLRRTMASRMGDLGVAPHVIEKCLNHALGGILAVYQRQEYLPERKAAFETWGNYLERITNSDQSNVVELLKAKAKR
jgi:integrase